MNKNYLRAAGLAALVSSGAVHALAVEQGSGTSALSFTGTVSTVHACDISASGMTFNFPGDGSRTATDSVNGVTVDCANGANGTGGFYTVAFSLSGDMTSGFDKDVDVTFDDGTTSSVITLSADDGTTDQDIDTAFTVADGGSASYTFTATMAADGNNGAMSTGQGATLYIAFDNEGDFSDLPDLTVTPEEPEPERSGLLDANSDGSVGTEDATDLLAALGGEDPTTDVPAYLSNAADYNSSGSPDQDDLTDFVGDFTNDPQAALVGSGDGGDGGTPSGIPTEVGGQSVPPLAALDGTNDFPTDDFNNPGGNEDGEVNQDDLPTGP